MTFSLNCDILIFVDWALAQLLAHHTGSVGVSGSNPLCSTHEKPLSRMGLRVFLCFGVSGAGETSLGAVWAFHQAFDDEEGERIAVFEQQRIPGCRRVADIRVL